MNASSKKILEQICKGGACPQTSIRTSASAAPAQQSSALIGQIINPRGPASGAAPPSQSPAV